MKLRKHVHEMTNKTPYLAKISDLNSKLSKGCLLVVKSIDQSQARQGGDRFRLIQQTFFLERKKVHGHTLTLMLVSFYSNVKVIKGLSVSSPHTFSLQVIK